MASHRANCLEDCGRFPLTQPLRSVDVPHLVRDFRKLVSAATLLSVTGPAVRHRTCPVLSVNSSTTSCSEETCKERKKLRLVDIQGNRIVPGLGCRQAAAQGGVEPPAVEAVFAAQKPAAARFAPPAAAPAVNAGSQPSTTDCWSR